MLQIRQTETGWELCRDGEVLTIDVDGTPTVCFDRYEDAVAVIARMLNDSRGVLQTETEGGDSSPSLLPETWQSPDDAAVCLSAETGDGRNFVDCEWSWRDPSVSLVPLMLQTETEFGHFGAELAGFVTEFFVTTSPQGVGARGRFYNSDAGIQFRDMLMDGRRFGVSVDPGAVTYEDECLEVNEEGWCDRWQTNFLTYQIIGVTGTPFPGFETAAIELGPNADGVAAAGSRPNVSTRTGDRLVVGEVGQEMTGGTGTVIVHAPVDAPVTAAGRTTDPLVAPPRQWFDDPGFLMPTPLTITNEGRVLGHVAIWNTHHTGRPGVTPPRGCDYLDFMVGSVIADNDDRVRTGVLTWMMEHPADELSYFDAIAAYNRAAADSGLGWADVVAGEDRHGPWVSGALRPGLTDVQIRVLRALSLSGDWRYSRRVARYEMLGCLAVNYPGFPITAASRSLGVATGRPHVSDEFQVITASSGMVPQAARRETTDDLAERVAIMERRFLAEHRSRLASIRRDVARERLRG